MIRLLLAICFCFTALAAEPAAEFESANRLYEKGEYAAAAAAYQQIIASGRTSAAVLFNLGNARFKNGEIGKAILAYRQARRLAPRDPDVNANLRFARGSVPGNRVRVTVVDRLLGLLSIKELAVLSGLGLWAWFGLLAAGQFRPAWKQPLRGWVVASGLAAVALSAWFLQAIIERASHQTAVVISPTAAVRFGPLEESQVSFNARDGFELQVIGRKDDWLQVTDSSDRAGWIPLADVAVLP